MYIPERNPLFRRQRFRSNPYRVAAMIAIILVMLMVLRNLDQGEITPLFMPTPTPTRTVASYAEEGATYFVAGDLQKAIEAYQQAVAMDPNNVDLQAELARIMVYSSTLLTVDSERLARLNEALEVINSAIEKAPENSNVHAIKAFVLDWLSDPNLAAGDRESLLTQAEQEVIYAIQLDNQNNLALAYYAEILVDQQKWIQAEQNIAQAVQRAPELMDVHRINGYVQESLGNYNQAIKEYEEAIRINPNLTFIYLRIGANYRRLAAQGPASINNPLYIKALEYFEKAAIINERLGVKDPIPYFSIATTYTQMGEFFYAGLNARKGLNFDPANADAYGRLGIVYHRARNYEGAIPAFACAINGCDAQVSCEVRQCDPETDPMTDVQGLPLSPGTVDYYLTYGAVLAGMHRPQNGYCEEAMRILRMVKRDYSDDPIIMRNVTESENICRSYGYY
ncbi:MAG: tetratricopeptide repeat protein [Pelolinea sp.]|nr:tetratricopeptide repeat protein [Pelolinea sp.]